MPRQLSVTVERFPIAGAFTISRGSRTEAAVIVATVRALKLNGGAAKTGLGTEDVEALRSGLANLADRAERRGGRLTASGGPSGSEVEWAVPLTR